MSAKRVPGGVTRVNIAADVSVRKRVATRVEVSTRKPTQPSAPQGKVLSRPAPVKVVATRRGGPR